MSDEGEFDNEREAYEEEKAELRAQIPKWQPIETSPKDETKVIIWCDPDTNGRDRVFIAYWNGEDWDTGDRLVLDAPTHWMPLPEPPK